ncbi:RNA polymerase sigma factor [Rheinheimera aquimaris]|jgi:RNA polymerase sigma-70 factor (ECF subfamily)|uniref:RNA polymerase sigma factor n=1 Tax=Rheinheimera aquimaris TaxID=412437 RepID=UPI001E49D2AB|nr:RNA polymerase sigma factor [Rheinheimera aquimaris]MCD1599112.1 RNA polymerase sigma factor [Rheinheimera aquimaris]|tara:strand:+ start:122 stop:643 length:522 start_codon:yes stop_codon:yes gene_type:complete
MAMEIAQAVAAAKEGDKKAFYQLYQQFVGRVYAICWRLLGNKQKAEDASQEIFIKVWQQLPAFRGDSSFGTWLHTIATRTAIDLWRQEKHLRLIDSSDEQPELADVATECSSAAPLEQAIQRLPAQARAVFVLFALEGYQHQEIATMLGIAEGTSKAQYFRARQLLQEWLADE